VLLLQDTDYGSLAFSQSMFDLSASCQMPDHISSSLDCCDQLCVVKKFAFRELIMYSVSAARKVICLNYS
jgi:hypothetical protein